MHSRKDEAVASSRESIQAVDSLRPGTEPAADCSDKNPHCDDSVLGMNTNSPQPIHTLTGLTDNKQQGEQAEPGPTSHDPTSTTVAGTKHQDLPCTEGETPSQASGELPACIEREPEPGPAAGDTNEEVDKEAPAVPGKTKAAPKRRSGRAANRR